MDVRPDLVKCYLLHTCAADPGEVWFPWPHDTVDLVDSYVCRVKLGVSCGPGAVSVMVNIFDTASLEGLCVALQKWSRSRSELSVMPRLVLVELCVTIAVSDSVTSAAQKECPSTP